MRGAYDFETYNWTTPLAVGLRWGDSDWLFYRDAHSPDAVARFALYGFFEVAKAGGPCEWWAHNGGNFDALAIMQHAAAAGYRLDINTAMGGRVVRLEIADGKGTKVTLKDSYAILPDSLKKVCKDFGLKTQKLFSADDYATDMRKAPLTHLEAGCRVDCEAVLEALDKVESLLENWGGKLKTTFGASALSCIKSTVALPKISPQVNQEARKAYYGGRVEVFEHAPPQTLRVYDVSSSYPWAMSQTLPHEYLGRLDAPSFLVCGLSDATVTVREDAYIPPLPYRDSKGGLYFPTGTWRAWFPNNLLAYAANGHGARVHCHETMAFSEWSPFKDFINKAYALKSTAQGAERSFAKYLLNSSYGKWGEHPEKEKMVLFPSKDEALLALIKAELAGTPNTVLGEDSRFQLVPTFKWPRHTHFAMAAYITGQSQALLHSYLRRAKEYGGTVAYCDTDSVHCVPCGALDEVADGKLGNLKVEHSRITANYFAPKVYEYLDLDKNEKHVASKGFRVDPDTFRRIIAGEEIARDTIMKAKSQLKTGNVFTRLEGEAAPKRGWSGRSMKRCPLPGGSTRPWSVAELEEGRHLEAVSPLGADAAAKYKERQEAKRKKK